MNRLFGLLSARSTSTSLALWIGGLFLVAFLLLGVGVYYAVSQIFAQDLHEVIRLDSQDLVELYRESGHSELATEITDRTVHPDDDNAVYELIGPHRRMLAGQFASLPDSVLSAAFPIRGDGWVQFRERNSDGLVRVVAKLQKLADRSEDTRLNSSHVKRSRMPSSA